jgi:hypothetical protein
MNVTTRSKWLIGLAALVVAYVIFGPKDPDPVEPARRAATPAALGSLQGTASASAAHSAAPLARSLLQLAHRVVETSSSGSLFAVHSWYVAPPPPPPVVEAPPPPPPPPEAPPLPFAYMGSYAPAGSAPVFFLTRGDKVYDVHVGDTLDDTYTVDRFVNGQLVLTYKPLNIQQQLTAGTSQ